MEPIAIVMMIESVARQNNFDPALLKAVAKVESSMNPGATGTKGEVGLFQIMPLHYSGDAVDLYNPKLNTRKAIKILKEAQKYCHTQENLTWLTCYNAGVAGAKRIKNPETFEYVVRVRKEYDKTKAREGRPRVKIAVN